MLRNIEPALEIRSIAKNQKWSARSDLFFFIWKGINFKVREVLSKRNSNPEIFSLEIENKNTKNLIIWSGYKAPSTDFAV